MLDMTWNLFCQTGNIETYLLLKELEQQGELTQEENEQASSSKLESMDLPSV